MSTRVGGHWKDTVKACGDLPLAIVLIAGVLSNNKTCQHWVNVARSTSSILGQKGSDISKMLSLSCNNHLPFQLKSCFFVRGGFSRRS